MDDPLIRDFNAGDLEIASEFLTNWFPFLSRDLCAGCSATLRDRIRSLNSGPVAVSGDSHAAAAVEEHSDPSTPAEAGIGCHDHIESTGWDTAEAGIGCYEHIEPTGWDTGPAPETPKVRMSWADMAQEDELEEAEAEARRSGPKVLKVEEKKKKPEISREVRERIRFGSVGRKKDFICLERVNGKLVNILDGLELHTGVFSAAEQKRIVDFVYELQEMGKNGQFGEHTYSAPSKWMRGKGRVTIQFGCCYNYAAMNGNQPGILENVVADPLPPLFKVIIERLVRWHVLPTTCVPDSCIVNIYESGDCIPPHIDSHDFVRPFTTVSFLSECSILFGSNLKILGPGEFSGSIAIPLPVGSVLVLNGNGADVAKHCVPAVPTKRISITFRKMDECKWPRGFKPEPDLQNIFPLQNDSRAAPIDEDTSSTGSRNKQTAMVNKGFNKGKKNKGSSSRAKPRLDHHNHIQHLVFDPEMSIKESQHRNVDMRPSVSSHSMERGRTTVGRSFDTEPYKPDLQDTRFLQEDANGLMRKSLHQGMFDDDGGSSEPSREYSGRRVQLEQQRIVISRNIRGEEEEPVKMSGHAPEEARFSRVNVRTLNNGRSRVRVNLAD